VQGFPDFDNAFSDVVKVTREETMKSVLSIFGRMRADVNVSADMDRTRELIEEELDRRIHQAMQAVVYNLNTMHSRAGSQVPFSSVNLGIPNDKEAALVCKAFLEEYDKGLGKGEQPIFPNIIFLVKEGVNANPEDPYYYLYELAIKVAANRMNPTFKLIDSSLLLPYYNKGIKLATMGCRTEILGNLHGDEGPMGRGNNFPVTLNLVRIGIEANKNWEKFYKLLVKQMDLCDEQLMYRYDIVKQLKVKDLPFVAGQHLMKGSENLGPDDSIESIMKNGTLGIGFIGLAETMIAMTGHHHGESQEYWDKAFEIITFMRTKVDEYKEKRNLNYSLYATPAEGLSGRFTPMDKKRYGIIPGVTDKEYYTNSFHIPVKYSISAAEKISLEAPFHKLCTAGYISYVEIDGGDIATRAEFIKRHLKYTRENTDASYVAYNFHIRYCKEHGHRIETNANECPVCGSANIQGVSRVTGYMSLDERFTPGKVAERRDRIKHEF
jgi:ribonucleoside-triphosphate reductase